MGVYTNEDLVQKALSVIYQKYKEVQFEKGILPWAYAILDNVFKSEYQTETRRKEIYEDNIAKLKTLFDNQVSAADEIAYHELIAEIRQALNRLTKKQKSVLELKLKGFTGSEIMDRLVITRNVMDIRFFRGLQKLREILETRGVM